MRSLSVPKHLKGLVTGRTVVVTWFCLHGIDLNACDECRTEVERRKLVVAKQAEVVKYG